jgi:hypothetical protein
VSELTEDAFPRATHDLVSADRRLRKSLEPLSEESGVPVEHLANLLDMRLTAPTRFAELTEQVNGAAEAHQARVRSIEDAANTLRESLEAHGDQTNPLDELAGRALLQQLEAKLKEIKIK